MRVTARGFLYQGSKGEWVLSSDPHLKACCIHSPSKINEQIILEGNLYPVSRVVNVTGEIRIEQNRILLTQAEIEPASFYFLAWIATAAFFAIGLAAWWTKKNKKKILFNRHT